MGVSAVIGVVGIVASHGEARKAREAEERRATAERNMRRAQFRREKIQAVREERIKRAQIQASLLASGGGGSSAEAGGLGSLRSQLASNLAFGEVMSQYQNYIYDEQSKVIAHQGRAQFYGDVSRLAASYAKKG